MVKKLDLFIIKTYIGPFVLITAVCDFILLLNFLLRYFVDIVGKNIGFITFSELVISLSINLLQYSVPLSVLITSLMVFGTLSEKFELTAIKSAGISLPRVLLPVGVLMCFLSFGMFIFNDKIIPHANLKAFSLLYDIKQAKPALDIKAGYFYNGIPNYSIKVEKKLPDDKTLLDVIIYDHTQTNDNREIIMADSAIISSVRNGTYLKFELFHGNYYSEETTDQGEDHFYRNSFSHLIMLFSLKSFFLTRRDEDLFLHNRQMKNIAELTEQIDLFSKEMDEERNRMEQNNAYIFIHELVDKRKISMNIFHSKDLYKYQFTLPAFFSSHYSKRQSINYPQVEPDKLSEMRKKLGIKEAIDFTPIHAPTFGKDTINLIDSETDIMEEIASMEDIDVMQEEKKQLTANIISKKKVYVADKLDDIYFKKTEYSLREVIDIALRQSGNIKQSMEVAKREIDRIKEIKIMFELEREKKYTQAVACLIMFLIGAPLGTLIRKGGLGIPILIGVFFFILNYFFLNMAEEYAKKEVIKPALATWLSVISLLPFGLFFLRQAKNDTRLLDMDVYYIWIENFKKKWKKKHLVP